LKKPVKLRAVDQHDIAPARKADGLVSEATRRRHESTSSALGRHHAVQLAHHVHPDLVGAPLFALHEKLLTTVLAGF